MAKSPYFFPGAIFGRLTIIERAGYGKHNKLFVKCKCECGTEKIINFRSILDGRTRSCGCLERENRFTMNLTHGKTHTMVHNIWVGMRQRCYNPNNPVYSYYGGRGIRVCDRWLESFENFYHDVGDPPSKKHSIDRYPDKDGDYGPDNFRWATKSEQAFNRRPKTVKA